MAIDLLNYQYRYKGIIWGANTKYGVIEEEGLDSLDVKSGAREFARQHGDIPGKHYAESKVIVQKIRVDSPTGTFEDVESDILDFKRKITVEENLSLNENHLEFKYPGRPQSQIRVRPINLPIKRQAVPGAHVIEFNIAFEASDPRVHHCRTRQITLPAYTPVGGVDLPANFPIDFLGNTETDLSRVASNTGNALAYPILRIWGPTVGVATRILLQNLTNGDVLDIETDIVSNQILTANMEAMVLAIGELPVHLDGSTRYGNWKLPRKPFVLSPGDNVVRLIVEGSIQGMHSLLTWNCTWL